MVPVSVVCEGLNEPQPSLPLEQLTLQFTPLLSFVTVALYDHCELVCSCPFDGPAEIEIVGGGGAPMVIVVVPAAVVEGLAAADAIIVTVSPSGTEAGAV